MSELSVSRTEMWRQRLQQLRTRGRGPMMFAFGVLAALVAVLLYSLLTPKPHVLTNQDVNASIVSAMASATPPPAFSALVYQAIRPSFVLIQTNEVDKDGKSGKGIGSGVIVTDQGDILTALHVVADATDIKVTFADGTESAAQVTTKQPENDIAVLQASQLPEQVVPATLGNPNAINIGDEAYAVGNPLGLYGSMSGGVISGLNRSFKSPDGKTKLSNLIQFDTAVNPGNSGGPLLNRAGEVIGIVTALANPTDQNFFIGIGFAVPITTAGGAAGLPPY